MKTPAEVDALGREKWQAGHVFAEALQAFLNRGQIGAVWVNDGFKHVYLSDAGFAFDSLATKENETDFWERWRLRYGANAHLEHAIVPKVTDLAACGISFGSSGAAALYRGPEYERWLKEAGDEIRECDFFRSLKNG